MGFVVLDAHHNPWDILLTARYFYKKNYQVLMPIAGYVFHVPILREVVRVFQRRYNVILYPVYRKEEKEPINILMKLLVYYYPNQMTDEERLAGNILFISKAIEFVKIPKHIVLVAPYGSPVWFGGKIKYGVRKILESGVKYCVSETKVKTRIGELRTYSPDSNLLEDFSTLTH